MFCKKCGKELDEDVTFCPDCGTRQAEIPDGDGMQTAGAEPDKKEESVKTNSGNTGSGKSESGKNIISRIWNSQLFTKAAIKFGNVLEILEGLIGLILSRLLFGEGGFWGIVFGIIFLLGGIGSCIGGVMSLLRRKKQDETETLDEGAINKKKRNLCIGTVVIVIALFLFINTGGGTYSVVQAITFDNIGPETIGELVDKNIKNPEWSQEKLDSSSKLVYVEGYCPAYGETVKIEFYYEKLEDGSHEVSLSGMYWPESDEEFNALESSIVWASFYSE